MTTTLIAATMAASTVLFFLVITLRRRLADQREIVHDMQRRYESLERELVQTAGKLKDQHQQVDHLAGLQNALKKKVAGQIACIEKALAGLRQEQNTFADKLSKVAQTPAQQPDAVAAVADSPLAVRVNDLSAQGKTSAEIARALGMQVGEVELIRGLKQYTGR